MEALILLIGFCALIFGGHIGGRTHHGKSLEGNWEILGFTLALAGFSLALYIVLVPHHPRAMEFFIQACSPMFGGYIVGRTRRATSWGPGWMALGFALCLLGFFLTLYGAMRSHASVDQIPHGGAFQARAVFFILKNVGALPAVKFSTKKPQHQPLTF